jgi:peptidylprolyl isomerase
MIQRILLLLLLSGALIACDDDDTEETATAEDDETETESALAAAQRAEQNNPAAQLGPPQPAAVPAPDDVAAPPDSAERSESGLAWVVLEEGTADARPGPRDVVQVNYTGWTTDGNMFDTSTTGAEPATLELSRVIPGWTEGVQLMATGEKRRFWIPEALAYGGRPGAPAGMLVFDIELVGFEAAPEPPETPRDVARAPRNAQRTESGLASRVLERGTGTEHPTLASVVQIHFSGWTTDGQLIDSSIMSGRPATFPLETATLEGWKEGIQLMVEGEKRRFWVPAALAQTGRPGGPQGDLVFDIELIRLIEPPPGGIPGMPPGGPGGPPPGPRGGPPPGTGGAPPR